MGGGISCLGVFGTQSWFGGTGITNNKIPGTAGRATVLWQNSMRIDTNIGGSCNAGGVDMLGTCNLTGGRTTTGTNKGCNKQTKGIM